MSETKSDRNFFIDAKFGEWIQILDYYLSVASYFVATYPLPLADMIQAVKDNTVLEQNDLTIGIDIFKSDKTATFAQNDRDEGFTEIWLPLTKDIAEKLRNYQIEGMEENRPLPWRFSLHLTDKTEIIGVGDFHMRFATRQRDLLKLKELGVNIPDPNSWGTKISDLSE